MLSENELPCSVKLVGCLGTQISCGFSLFPSCSSNLKTCVVGEKKHRSSIWKEKHSIEEDLFSFPLWQNISPSADKGQKSVMLEKGMPLKVFSAFLKKKYTVCSYKGDKIRSYFLTNSTIWKSVYGKRAISMQCVFFLIHKHSDTQHCFMHKMTKDLFLHCSTIRELRVLLAASISSGLYYIIINKLQCSRRAQ